MFVMLEEKYFPRYTFRLVYLSRKKFFYFIENIDFVSFTRGLNGLRLLVKYKDRVLM